MDARLAFSIAALGMFLVPGGAAEAPEAGTPVDDVQVDKCLDARAAPPCGYILPTIDIDVPEKQACGGGRLVYAEEPPEDCDPLMPDGGTKAYDAIFKWYWEASEDGTYPKEVGQDIEVSFSGTATNPKWLTAKVEGEGMQDGRFIITDADLVHPDNIRLDDSSGNMRVWYEYIRPITITFTRDGSPSGDEFSRIDARHGVPAFFMKAKSTASEPRFKEAFGVEEFRFNTCSDAAIAAQVKSCPGVLQEDGTYAPLGAEDEQAPGLAPIVGLLALVGLALRRRR